jgi:hypothetical protein
MTDTTAATAEKVQPRLKQKYRDEIKAALTEQFGYANVNQVPGLVKVVVNTGVGEAARDSKIMDGALKDLTAITGQKPQVTLARKSIAQFKLREGQAIGAHVTLRGDRAWEFLDRLLSLGAERVPRDRPGPHRPRAWVRHHRRDHREDGRRRPRAAPPARLPVPFGRADGLSYSGRCGPEEMSPPARSHEVTPIPGNRPGITSIVEVGTRGTGVRNRTKNGYAS